MRYRNLSWKDVLHTSKNVDHLEVRELANKLGYMFYAYDGKVYETVGTVTETYLDIDVK